jgi:hypothetical protein
MADEGFEAATEWISTDPVDQVGSEAKTDCDGTIGVDKGILSQMGLKTATRSSHVEPPQLSVAASVKAWP